MNETPEIPIEQLEGVALCEKVAWCMGWKLQSPTDSHCNQFQMPNGTHRFIPNAPEEMIYDWSSKNLTFRPDLDWNHLREVVEEIGRREWFWFYNSEVGIVSMGKREGPPDYYCLMFVQGTAKSLPVAFLRAFVSACRAEIGMRG